MRNDAIWKGKSVQRKQGKWVILSLQDLEGKDSMTAKLKQKAQKRIDKATMSMSF